MTVAITVEHNEARLAGTLAFLDAGSNPARLRIPASPRGLTAVGIVANQLREIEASLSAAVPQVRELREFLTRSTLSGAIDLMIDQ